jgi:phage I-like protein
MSDENVKTPSALPGHAVLGAAHAFRAGEAVEGELPKRIKILDWGENLGRTTGAKIVVGEKSLKCLSANQKRFARDTVVLDYEHQSVPGHPRYKEDPRHNAAHGQIEIVEGEGVFMTSLAYTPNGREHALSYSDVSPVARFDSDGNLLLIDSVALTQTGDVAGLTFEEAVAALSAQTPSQIQTQDKPDSPQTMDKDTDKFRDLLISILGLKAEDGEDKVSDEAIAAAAAKHMEKPSPKKDAPEGEVAAMSARLDAMERSNIVQGAVLQGKVIPLSAEQIDVTDIGTLRAIVDKLPAGEVPTSRQSPQEKPGDKSAALSADDRKIMAQLGLTEDEFRQAQA